MNDSIASTVPLWTPCFYLPKRNMNEPLASEYALFLLVFIFLRGIWTYIKKGHGKGCVYSFYLPKRNMNALRQDRIIWILTCFYLPKRNMNDMLIGLIIDAIVVFIFLRGIWTMVKSLRRVSSYAFLSS